MRARFADFVVDCTEQRLLRAGAAIALRGKSFALLCLLVRRPGQLVAREKILDELWGDVSVTEHGLSVCVSEVRAALGDSATKPRFIQTVHGVGYRFIAELVEDATAAGTATVSLDEPVTPLDTSIWCVWSAGAPQSQRLDFSSGARELGRGTIGAFVLHDPAMSREHARVTLVEGRFRVTDHGSRNGSVLDGRPLRGASASARAESVLRTAETVFVLAAQPVEGERASEFTRLLAEAAPRGRRLRASFVERALRDPRRHSPGFRATDLFASVRLDGEHPLSAVDYPES